MSLLSIQIRHPDCIRPKKPVEIDDEHQQFVLRLEDHIMKEERSNAQILANRKKSNKAFHKRAAPKESSDKYSRFQTCRIFLNQMGYFSFDKLKDGNMLLLSKGHNLMRDIKGLDKKYSYEQLLI